MAWHYHFRFRSRFSSSSSFERSNVAKKIFFLAVGAAFKNNAPKPFSLYVKCNFHFTRNPLSPLLLLLLILGKEGKNSPAGSHTHTHTHTHTPFFEAPIDTQFPLFSRLSQLSKHLIKWTLRLENQRRKKISALIHEQKREKR